jgi:SAM-dependent methyltransferase
MDHREVGRYWDANADAWTTLSRAGYDIYRDWVNTPEFFKLLPSIDGLRVLDIGCGEGYNTRLLVDRGARVIGIDISSRFIEHAVAHELEKPLGIHYRIASAVELPFADASFDAATAFMSLMDIPENDRALAEAYRVIVPGGFLQFSITHPCFNTPRSRAVYDANRVKIAVEVGDYFGKDHGVLDEWLFSAAPVELRRDVRPFRVPRFRWTLSEWLNLVLDTGFIIERVAEPYPSDEAVRAHPKLARARVVSDFLQVRARKP